VLACLSAAVRADEPPPLYLTLAALPKTRLPAVAGELDVAFAPGTFSRPYGELLDWTRLSVQAVSAYYGRFPVRHGELLVVPVPGDTVRAGIAYGDPYPAVRVLLGQDVGTEGLTQDGLLTHELVHLATPMVARRHYWLLEGIATYVGPIARAQAGQLSDEQVWAGFLRGMAKGLPQDGEGGLDGTSNRAREYWGGTLFCLLADLRIRQQTGNRLGLQDALRAMIVQGGGIADAWPVERLFSVGDQATGTRVLSELYDEMKDQPVQVDLAALWDSLGVRMEGGRAVLDAVAPLAAVRQAITAPRTSSP